MDYFYGLLSGLGFIIILNNYIVYNINNSLGDFRITTNEQGNKLMWNIFKIYSNTRHKALQLLDTAKTYITYKKLRKNILFVNNGLRTNNIEFDVENVDKEDIHKCLETYANNCDLILYRSPSQSKNEGYDLIRIIINDNKDISISDKITDYTCYSGKLHSPIVTIENNEDKYELDIKDDNYYINDNMIYDTPFIKWILREQHDIVLDDNDKYTIHFFDEDMCEVELSKTEALCIKNDSIKKIDVSLKKSNELTDCENNDADSKGWLW